MEKDLHILVPTVYCKNKQNNTAQSSNQMKTLNKQKPHSVYPFKIYSKCAYLKYGMTYLKPISYIFLLFTNITR